MKQKKRSKGTSVVKYSLHNSQGTIIYEQRQIDLNESKKQMSNWVWSMDKPVSQNRLLKPLAIVYSGTKTDAAVLSSEIYHASHLEKFIAPRFRILCKNSW